MRNGSEKRGFVEGPGVLPACGLNQGGKEGFGNMKSREPHDRWLARVNPVVILFKAHQQMNDPVAQILQRCRRQSLPYFCRDINS